MPKRRVQTKIDSYYAPFDDDILGIENFLNGCYNRVKKIDPTISKSDILFQSWDDDEVSLYANLYENDEVYHNRLVQTKKNEFSKFKRKMTRLGLVPKKDKEYEKYLRLHKKYGAKNKEGSSKA